jgi:hypothetical protein
MQFGCVKKSLLPSWTSLAGNVRFCTEQTSDPMNIKTAAIIIGVTFIFVGILGFIPNPIVSDSTEAIFHADAVHSSVHLVSGLLFLVFAYSLIDKLSLFMKVFGAVYFLLGVLGLFSIGSNGMTRLLGFLHVNGADNYLHIVLGVAIFAASTLNNGVGRRD